MQLAEQIKLNRERTGLSQEDLAHEIYVSRQTVSNWETSKTYPDVQSLLLMSKLFDVPIDELVKGDMNIMKEASIKYEKDRWIIKAGTITSLALSIFGCFAAVFLVRNDISFYSPLFLLMGIPLAAALVIAIAVQRIEERHDLDTRGEVAAFLAGTDPEDIARDRKLPRWLRLGFYMILGGVIGVAMSILFASLAALFALA